MQSHDGFQEAYVATLKMLRDKGHPSTGVSDTTSIGSHFGKGARPTREALALSFQFQEPRRRLVHISARGLSAKFLVANFLWTIAGGHDVQMISSYNDKARSFARDSSYFEASFGSRLFSPGNQLRMAERRLRADRESRRASAVIYLAEDSIVDRLDVPCALGLQFFIRDNKLICIALMRSQSAAMVMPYDVFLFSMLQEVLAVRLGTQLGPYIHFASSMHYYEEEQATVEAILANDSAEPTPMPAMLQADDKTLEELINAERAIRHARRAGISPPDLAMFGLDAYWLEFLAPLFDELDTNRDKTTFWNAI